MSFDKAPIKRFNEEASCAPPPTKYDPKLQKGSQEVNFGSYSGRTDPLKPKDGFAGFALPSTPGPSRGRPSRPLTVSSVRSSSDTRIRLLRSRSRSTSSSSVKSLKDATNDNSDGEAKKHGVNPDQDLYSANIAEKDAEIMSLNLKLQGEKELQIEMEKELTSVRGLLVEESMKYEKAQHEKQTLLLDNQELQVKLSEKDAVLTELQRSHLSAVSELDSAHASYEELQLNHQLLTEDIKALKASAEQEKQTLLLGNQELEVKLSEKDASLIELQRSHLSAVSEISSLKSITERDAQTITSLNSKLQNEQALHESIVTKLEAELASVLDNLAETSERYEIIQHEKEEVVKCIQELQSQFGNMQMAYEELQTNYQSLIYTNELLKTNAATDAATISSLNLNLQHGVEHRTELESELDAVRKHLTEKEAKIDLIGQEKQTLLLGNQELQKALKVSAEVREVDAANISALDLELKKGRERQLELESEMDAFRNLVAEKEAKIDLIGQEKQTLLLGNQELQKALKVSAEVREVDAANISALDLELKKGRERQLELESEMDAFRNLVAEKEAKIDLIGQEKQSLLLGNQELQKALKVSAEVREVDAANISALDLELKKGRERQLELESEMDAFRNLVAEKEAKIDLIGQEKQTLLLGNKELQAELSEKDALLIELQQSHLSAVSELDSAHASYGELQLNHQLLIEDIKALKASAEVDAANISALNLKLKEGQERQLALESEMDAVRKLLTEKEAKIDLIGQEKQTLLLDNQELQAKLSEKDALLTDLQQSHLAVVSELDSAHASYEQLQLNHQLLTDDTEALKASAEVDAANISELNLKLKKGHERQLELESEMDAVRKLLTEKEAKVDLIGQEKQTLLLDNQELQAKLSEKDALLTDLQRSHLSAVSELNSVHASYGELQLNHQLLTDDIEALKASAEVDAANISALNLKLKEGHERQLALESEMDAVLKLLTEKEANIDLIGQEKQTLLLGNQELQAKLSEKDALLIELQQSHLSAVSELDSAHASYEELQLNHQLLTEDIKALKASAEVDAADISALNLKLKGERERQLELESEMDAVRKLLTEKEAKIDLIGQEKQYLSQCIEQLQLQLSDINASHQALQLSQQSLLDDNTLLKKKADSLTLKLNEQEEQLMEMNTFKDDKESLQSQLKDLQIENENLKERVSYYEGVYGDYAQLVGHQNNRQKIHHVIKIKDENLKLRAELDTLRQKCAKLQERSKQSQPCPTGRRFDPSQAFKPVLKEPFIRDERDVRGPDARSTFTIPKSRPSPPITIVDSARKEPKQGMTFDICFPENKEN